MDRAAYRRKRQQEEAAKRRAQEHRELARFYNLNSMLGNNWAIFYFIIGARMTGKSYSVTDFLCRQKMKLGSQCKNYWFRINDSSVKALLVNKADKLIDPDLKRKYKLDLSVKGREVRNNGEEFMYVAPLSSFGKLKGVGFYDKDFKGWYNIVLDEFQLETGEKRTTFDILYAFTQMCENVARTEKKHIRVFLLGNTLEESSTVLKAFNFMPEKFGRYYLKSKRCVIDNLEVTEAYKLDRTGSVADILAGGASNYTNELIQGKKQLFHGRLNHPTALIKFTKEPTSWFTVFDGKVIRRYRGEGVRNVIAMRPYLDELYVREKYINVLDMYDARAYYFDCLVSEAYFTGELVKLRTK